MHSRRNNNTVKHLHERCLWLLYNDKWSSYKELSLKDGSVSIHHRNIENLAVEMFKVKNDLSPENATDTFLQQTQTQQNLRHYNDFTTPLIRSVFHAYEKYFISWT